MLKSKKPLLMGRFFVLWWQMAKKKTILKNSTNWKTEATANKIFAEMASKRSLRDICRENNWPFGSVYKWLKRDYEEQYARAYEERADALFDELIEIADEPMIDAVQVSQAKLRIDARKWVMSRMCPKKYADKVETNVTGSIDIKKVLVEFVDK